MRERRVTRWTCMLYDGAVRRYLDGTANPKRKSDPFTVTEPLGLIAFDAGSLRRPDSSPAGWQRCKQPLAN